MVDKNLFMYDLAIAAIMKNEGPYVKEWLDYHLLAGVKHFYIYDNESTDNIKEILQPYIDKEIVTYTFYPGQFRQCEAYNDAVLNYKFNCRYMAFIDADEFIFPQDNKSVVEVLDEILVGNSQARGLAINWLCFGSNFQEKADYSRGVLERFTRCDSKGHMLVKTVANPRMLNWIDSPHFPRYFEGVFSVNANGEFVPTWGNNPAITEKIRIHHYVTKSAEEYRIRLAKKSADHWPKEKFETAFAKFDTNEVFDDSIIKYRDNKLSENNLKLGGG